MIRVLASGTLHDAPQARTSANGNPYTTAKLRADDGKGGSIWCSLIAFGSEAKRLATLKAGAALSVSGRAEVSAWLDKQGEPKAGLSVVVDDLASLRGKPKPRSVDQEAGRSVPARSKRADSTGLGGPNALPFDDLDDWQP
jgi:single-stranded DNA-binding protein